MSEPTYHPEEMENAEKEGRPVLVSRMLRYDHLTHEIPLGSVVEVNIAIYRASGDVEVNLKGSCRLVVVGHLRDCDGTPLYAVSDLPVKTQGITTFTSEWLKFRAFAAVWEHGYSAESLKPTGTILPLCETLQEYYEF